MESIIDCDPELPNESYRLPRTLWVLLMTLGCAHFWFYRQLRVWFL